jgi:hypothetical protein
MLSDTAVHNTHWPRGEIRWIRCIRDSFLFQADVAGKLGTIGSTNSTNETNEHESLCEGVRLLCRVAYLGTVGVPDLTISGLGRKVEAPL